MAKLILSATLIEYDGGKLNVSDYDGHIVSKLDGVEDALIKKYSVGGKLYVKVRFKTKDV